MANEVYDAEGNLVEDVVTKEDLEEKIEQAKSSVTEEFQEKIDELEQSKIDMEEELIQAQENLEKEKDKDKNFGLARQSIKSKEEKIKELEESIKGLNEKIDDVTTESKTGKVDTAIKEIVKKDSELGKKVRFYYDQFSGVPENDEQFQERIKNAHLLATGGKDEGLPFGVISSAGGSPPIEPGSPEGGEVSPETKQMAKEHMGLTDRDFAKKK